MFIDGPFKHLTRAAGEFDLGAAPRSKEQDPWHLEPLPKQQWMSFLCSIPFKI